MNQPLPSAPAGDLAVELEDLVASLSGIENRPLAEQAAAFEQAHRTLSAALATPTQPAESAVLDR